MRFSVRYDFRNPPRWHRSWQDLYRQLLDQAVLADEMGYDAIWLSEHHFTEDGYCPAILPLLGALTSRTQRARLGTFILLLPLYHPLRLAEDVATLDLLSGGRIDLGVAAGYRPEEFAAHNMSTRERAGRMEEGLELLIQAWTKEEVSFAGAYYTAEGLPVRPRPLQQPHPPLWMGGESPAAIRRAARYGCHFMPTTTGHDTVHAYREELARLGRDPTQFQIALPRVIYVIDDPEAGWQELRDHLLYQHNVYCGWAADAGLIRRDRGRPLRSPEELPRDQYIIGEPAFCTEALEKLRTDLAVDEITLWAVLPGFDIGKSTRSLERFAAEVMPHFQ